MATDEYLDVAVAAARAAGEELRDAFHTTLDVRWKAKDDIVTNADIQAERIITHHLRDAFPDHTIIAEESGEHPGSAARWHVDPLDGTTNFARGIPYYSVSLALERDGDVHVGVTYLPAQDDLYTAVRGHTPRLNNDPITVSATTDLGDAVVALGFSRTEPGSPGWLETFATINNAALRTRHMGSIATDLALLANGAFDGLYGTLLRSWDVAAGIALIEAAGGTITKLTSQDGLAGGYLASNAHLHDDLLACLPDDP